MPGTTMATGHRGAAACEIPPAGSAGEAGPILSVVLPVLNEARDIGRLLGELKGQIPPAGGLEILVVDGGSTDGTRAIVAGLSQTWPALRLLENPRKLSSAGRNVGVRAARGSYVLFLDGHCALLRSDYLARVVALFESTGVACLSRPQPLLHLAEGAWARATAAARHSRLGHNPSSDIYGGTPAMTDPRSAGAAYVRSCFEQLGGYDERFDACEDVEFNHRLAAAGLRAYRHPDLTVAYRPRAGLSALWRQMIRYGRGRARLMACHPALIPWPLVAISGLLLVAILAWPLFGAHTAGAIAAAACAGWSLTVLAESLRLGRVTAHAVRIALAFGVIHAGLLLGFWRGLAESRRFRSPMALPRPAGERAARGSPSL